MHTDVFRSFDLSSSGRVLKRTAIQLAVVFVVVLGLTTAARAQAEAPLQAEQRGSIAYFLYGSSALIKRYDLLGQVFLPDIPLSASPTAFTVDDDGIYVSFGRRTARLDLAGSTETHLVNTNEEATSLEVSGDYVYVVFGESVVSTNKWSGGVIDQIDYWHSMTGTSIAPALGKIFSRSVGISPSDILQLRLGEDGTLGGQTDSSYHGDYPNASRTYVFPGEARVVDSAGIIYSTSDLSYNNSLAGAFDDLGFYGNLPIVLRGATIYSYSNTFLETGNYTGPVEYDRIFVEGDNVFAFYDLDISPSVEIVPIASLTPDTPGPEINPQGLAYIPDEILHDGAGTLYLLSNANLSIFQWSLESRSYQETITLTETATHMAYSEQTNTLYLSYASGKITQIPLSDSRIEVPFANSPAYPKGLATAGSYVFVVDDTGAWDSHFTYDPSGILISQVEWNYYSREYIWSEANRKMYFFRDDTSPNDLLWEDIDVDGYIGIQKDSPYHSSSGILHPIRVAPDGSIVILGSGRIYDAITLEQIDTLFNNISDAAWVGDELYTLTDGPAGTSLQQWGENYALVDAIDIVGLPLRLFQSDAGALVVTNVEGAPRFSYLDVNAARRDLDSDGILDMVDNCIRHSNSDQRDSNGDGFGNICDADLNQSGLVDAVDMLLFRAAFASDADDPDLDGDGIVGINDLLRAQRRQGKPPGPSGLVAP
ncbi:hypothetical protein E4634_06805 [Mangrovimicrobium sediminis]|uniref:Dockerin domain-containing protein n=1 Tax=Mangrovimicrobium sediminis TaxID=2562682 RepID=A0A4Z0M646_9GAMM|nr:hypothetical protein [Haliea sp. SAOS-164]TGD74896.1 hypothetical protein E4634_06805 [Haliea sp. SAOS-164]